MTCFRKQQQRKLHVACVVFVMIHFQFPAGTLLSGPVGHLGFSGIRTNVFHLWLVSPPADVRPTRATLLSAAPEDYLPADSPAASLESLDVSC